jgi:alcohol dehydrogenase
MSLSPLAPFTNHLPVRVRFGDGVLAQLPEVLSALGAQQPIAFVDAAVADLPAVRAALEGATVRALPAGEPSIEDVDAAAEAVAAHDAVIAIGGGSVLDTAKGARLVAGAGGSIRRFAWPGDPEPIPAPQIPLVTVPTTAGTGSEVTGGIVMLDRQRELKCGAASPHNRAQDCLVDPLLTHSLPPGPTLHGGLDVLAQAIGAIVVVTRTPVADALAAEALRLVRDALPAVVSDGADAGARSRMACASLLAGFAMNLSEAGTDHSLGHALGVRFGIPHGLSVGVMLAEAMEHDRLAVPDRFEYVADALGAPDAVDAVRALLARVGCPTLGELGVGAGDVDALTEVALRAWIPVEPGPWTPDDIAGAYRRALQITRRIDPEEEVHGGGPAGVA